MILQTAYRLMASQCGLASPNCFRVTPRRGRAVRCRNRRNRNCQAERLLLLTCAAALQLN